MKISYLGWLGHCNYGDEAMFNALKSYISGNNFDLAELRESNFLDYLVVGGGTFLSSYNHIPNKIIENARNQDVRYSILGTGIDQTDLPTDAECKEVRISSRGISLLKNNIDNAEFVFLRDVKSIERLDSFKIDISKCELIGDLSLLLKSNFNHFFDCTFIPDKAIAINVGQTTQCIYGNDKEKLIKCIIKLCKKITKLGIMIYLFPMWKKDVSVIIEISKSIKSSLVQSIPFYNDYRKCIALLSKMDLVISMKLHGLIFSALVNVPFISIAYREKCISFCESMEMEDFYCKTDSENLDEVLYEKVLYVFENRNNISRLIENKVDNIISITMKKLDKFTKNI